MAGRDAGVEAVLSDEYAGDGLRYYFLLGGPHGDDGAGIWRGYPLSSRLYSWAGARQSGPQDEQVAGQRYRPRRGYRQIWRGYAALHAGHRQHTGQRYALLLGTR